MNEIQKTYLSLMKKFVKENKLINNVTIHYVDKYCKKLKTNRIYCRNRI